MADNSTQQKTKEKVEQNDPNGAVCKSVKTDLMCGDAHQFSIFRPSVIIDSHMHIESGRCATLPFVWDSGYLPQVLTKVLKVPRPWVEDLGSAAGSFIDGTTEWFLTPVRWLTNNKDHNGSYTRETPLKKFTKMQEQTTEKIGNDFINIERRKVYEDYFQTQKLYKGLSHLVLTSVVMTMDMEYAHIDGYYGFKIYNAIFKSEESMKKQEDPIAYWIPQHGFWRKGGRGDDILFWRKTGRGDDVYTKAREDESTKLPTISDELKDYKKLSEKFGITGTYYDSKKKMKQPKKIFAVPCLMSDGETKRYERWEKQLQSTEMAVLANPLKLLPMFHYDPRRWQPDGNEDGNVFPMAQVTGAKALYLGFKMYTAQGYRPLDPRLPIMEDFYARCCDGRIPIMNHCTPGGAATVEKEEYIKFKHDNDSTRDDVQKTGKSAVDYFDEYFVSPYAWKDVLDKTVGFEDKNTKTSKMVPLNNLHICLAHFGGPTPKGMKWNQQIIEMIGSGKYPNLYTDISSSFASDEFCKSFKAIMTDTKEKEKVERLKSRILFGTDWYMTLNYKAFSVSKDYFQYCSETKDFLDKFDTSLWPRFTQYNPYRFYRLDEQIDRIKDNIIWKRQNDEKVQETLKELKTDKIEEIEKEAAYIKVANQSYVNYEETPCSS